jgi:hypothetical protein
MLDDTPAFAMGVIIEDSSSTNITAMIFNVERFVLFIILK